MDFREQRSVILQMLGMGTLETRWHAIEASVALTNERMHIRMLAMRIPVVVYLTLSIVALIAVVRAVRAIAAGGDEGDADADAMLPESVTTPTSLAPSGAVP
jgi:hypothetical protein